MYFHFSQTLGKFSALLLDTMAKDKYKQNDNVGVVFIFIFLLFVLGNFKHMQKWTGW